MRKMIIVLLTLLTWGSGASAQNEVGDSIHSQELNEVVVEGLLQQTSATVSTYIPTSKQKNASQTGTDLLNRMAIPQLAPTIGNSVKTAAGKSVDIFIDYLPASEQDIIGMRMNDVKKVEYYDYPDDPRFLGKPHVVNFIMQKYQYGGYIKGYASEFFVANSGQLNLYSKFQYKKMTYDLAVGGYYMDGKHSFNNTSETYRLPQSDGTFEQFERFSDTKESEMKRRYLWPTFKALYSTDNITMSNTIGGNFDNFPKENRSGAVHYSPSTYSSTEFAYGSNHRENYLTYNGYWNFILPHTNTITFTPYYSYSHSTQNSAYTEGNTVEYINSATDNSQVAKGVLQFQHNFGKWGNLFVSAQGIYTGSRTKYSGTTSLTDKLTTLRVGPGVTYSYASDHLYAMVGIGFTYDRSKLGDITEKNTKPWVDFSLQYSFNDKNSFDIDFHHANGVPDLSNRSSAIILSNPLMRYTGNPNLTPYKSYDLGLSYLWMPNNVLRFSVYGNGFLIDNRFAYVYEASSSGILRTVQQPVGKYWQGQYGLNASASLLEGKLQINGQVAHKIVKNGTPFDWTKSNVNWYLQAFYYVDQWHFGIQYQSERANADSYMKGTWVYSKSAYTAIAGWGNSSWSVQGIIANPFRWNWRSETTVLKSRNYDYTEASYNPNNHCFIYVTATYTFGFGKKINVGNEASQQSGAGNAILK